jgi:hypothetical protein
VGRKKEKNKKGEGMGIAQEQIKKPMQSVIHKKNLEGGQRY